MSIELRQLPSGDKVPFDEQVKRFKQAHPHTLPLVNLIRQYLKIKRMVIAARKPWYTIDKIIASTSGQRYSLRNPSLHYQL